MARKRKTAAERLRQEIKRVRDPHHLRNLIRRTKPDWTDEPTRGAYANAVLTLDGEPSHSPLRNAFQQFDLDPADPFNWRRLLASLAAIVFVPAPVRLRGARPKWDEHRRLLFQTHVATARKKLRQLANRSGGPQPTSDLIADYLRYKWPDHYASISAASIRKYVVSGPPKGRR
jgi:hypothetical protein